MRHEDPIVIVSAKRTPIGAFNGAFKNLSAQELGSHIIQSVLEDASFQASDIDEVIMGQVLTTGLGQNPARQSAIAAGIPEDKTALTVNQVCGSGLRTVAMGMQSIANDDASIIVAGGQENMTLSPHCMHMREGVKFGNVNFIDTMVHDGLWDVFNDYHMGITAENIAEKWQITRQDQDNFAAHSQQKAEKAINEGKFKEEISAVTVKSRKDEKLIDKDEFPRSGVTAEALSALRPAFKKDGTVTAGNASGINDGAAAVLIMKLSEAQERGLEVFAQIKSWATAGVSPAVMGSGPVPASKKALDKAGWDISDLDLVESNEAFAAQACCVIKELGLNSEIVNVNGGAISLGHPIGASGTRVLVTLLHEMARRDAQKGLVTLCIGGGMGIAMCLERNETLNLRNVA
jgi:acetyl-CoA C-acetyltransferase